MKKTNFAATEITMDSAIIDFYMEGYNEGKDDDVQTVRAAVNTRKAKSDKERFSARRKKAYYKAKRRMAQLNDVDHYTPAPECEEVVFGMLRSHQLSISDPILTFGCPIGDKKRQDAAEQRLVEHANGVDDEPISA